MSFLRNHGTFSGLGALLGAGSAYAGVRYLFTTPEIFLAAHLGEYVEFVVMLFGYSDLAEFAPWWPRDTPLLWMLPVTACLAWLLTVPCRPSADAAAASAYVEEQRVMEQLRLEGAVATVQHAELKTPSSKTFGKLEREAAEKAAQVQIVSQLGADVGSAQVAHAEYEAFLKESALEWRLLRFEAVVGYVLGWLAVYMLGVVGFAAVPLVALVIPLALFVVLVSATVLYEWTVHLAAKACGCCAPDADVIDATWGVALRDASAAGTGCCASMGAAVRACCEAVAPKTAAQYWGVQLRPAPPGSMV